VHADRRPFLIARNRTVAALRRHFEAQGFLEVEAGALQVSPGNETHLHAFGTELIDPAGGRWPLYLHTSPEFACKKLLAAGEERIFTFARVFRNRERSALHAPEFTMLEWYRANEPYEQLMEDCAAVLACAAEAAGATEYRFRGAHADPFAAPERITVAEAFARYAGIDLIAMLPDSAGGDAAPSSPGTELPYPHASSSGAQGATRGPRDATHRSPGFSGLRYATPENDTEKCETSSAFTKLAEDARRIGVRTAADDTWSDILSRILVEKIEPRLGLGRATILADYPASEAALARRKPSDPRFAERFELYVCGVELANAFGELTDPAEQRRRFAADMDEKALIYGERYPIDEDLLAALALMPPASGIALGLDRLVMLATGASRIDQVIWTPF
jgi:lysyl-tRNA synthetase class 2